MGVRSSTEARTATVRDDGRPERPVDLRMIAPAVAAWAGAVLATRLPADVALLSMAALVAAGLAARHLVPALRPRTAWVLLVLVLLVAAVVLGTWRASMHRNGPLADLAAERATISATASVTSDPRTVDSQFSSMVVFTATVTSVEARGSRTDLRADVVVFAHELDAAVELGATIDLAGRLGPSDDSSQAATVSASSIGLASGGDPAWWWDGAERVRDAVSASVAQRSDDVAALVPALVHGDDHALGDDVSEAFQTSGLTHLLAVSGTNLTLIVGALLAIARPLGAGPRVRVALAVLATVGFVLLARPEPSVVRAAVMGLVGVAGLSTGGRARGARCLAWAVVVVVLVDPWLATSAGFLLSALATGGIVLLAPVWRDALSAWMPRWAAEAVAVPAAAQLACTAPVVALSGEVSLVAVVANLLVAPAVGPATVLGVAGGLLGLVWAPLGVAVGLATAIPAGWIVVVGRRAAALPGAAASVGDSALVVGVVVVVVAVVAVSGHRVLRRPLATCALAGLTVVAVLAPPSPGWPPRGWVMVACDVGQGDATVLRAGQRAAVVVDAGPDPLAVDRCLRDLGVQSVPALVLTHAHADHVDGIAGVADGRSVGWIGMGPSGVRVNDMPTRHLAVGDRWQAGGVTMTVLAPAASTAVPTDETANDASVVLLAETTGVRILLTGDVEPPAQQALHAAYPSLRVDVLKVPHHGSAHQDADWLASLGARWATVSSGAGNSYGHPSPKTLTLLEGLGTTLLRTDPGRDVAVVVRDGELGGVVR